MKRQILLFILALMPIVANADAVEIDGICYNLISKGKVAEVTRNINRSYSGNIIIPDFLQNNSYPRFILSEDRATWLIAE